jgi:hypothetical protein
MTFASEIYDLVSGIVVFGIRHRKSFGAVWRFVILHFIIFFCFCSVLGEM